MTKRNVGRPPMEQPMVHVTLRLPQDVVERYREYENYTAVMRQILTKYVDKVN